MNRIDQLVRAVLALGPSTRQGEWRTAENSACLAVQGLRILQHDVLLPQGIDIPRPDSPIIGIDQAEELYALAAPSAAQQGVLRPLLIRLMVANDQGTNIEQLTALWAMFEGLDVFEALNRRGAPPQPHHPQGQAIVGRERLYITSYRGWRSQLLDPAHFAVLKARDGDPAEWTAEHDRLWRKPVGELPAAIS